MWPEMGIEFQVLTAPFLPYASKPQNSEIELQDQYSTNSLDLSFPLKLLILAFSRAQERPYGPEMGIEFPSVHCS